MLGVTARNTDRVIHLLCEWSVFPHEPDRADAPCLRRADCSAHVLRAPTRADCHQRIAWMAKRIHLPLENSFKTVVVGVRSYERGIGRQRQSRQGRPFEFA